MAKARTDLKSALKAANDGVTAPPTPTPAKKVPSSTEAMRRKNKEKISVQGWFFPEVRSSLRLIQVKHPEKNVQGLLGEALNLLFAKYNVPESVKFDK